MAHNETVVLEANTMPGRISRELQVNGVREPVPVPVPDHHDDHPNNPNIPVASEVNVMPRQIRELQVNGVHEPGPVPVPDHPDDRPDNPNIQITHTAATNTGVGVGSMPHQLMFLGKLVDGVCEPAPLILEGQTVKTLSAWCKEYSLPYTGKKEVLKARLTAFSEDKEQWDMTVPGATRKHHNPTATTTYKRPPKQSMRRREAMLSSSNNLTGQEEMLVHLLPTEVSVDNRTDQEANGYLEWADMIMTMYPYPVPPIPGTFTRQPPLTTLGLTAPAHALTLEMSSLVPVEPPLSLSAAAALKASVDQNTMHLQQLLARVGAVEPDTSMCPVTSNFHQPLPAPLITDVPSSSPPPSQPTLHPSSPVLGILPSSRTLVFIDGTQLYFTESQVPDPPPTTFADNIPRLNAIWDGPALHPADESPLVINGKPIPLVYWPKVYKYWKADQWKGTKGKWFEWKVIVNRWRQGSAAEFWAEFSVNGKYLTYTAIVARLAKQREVEDATLAETARSEYGSAFAETFKYRRGSNWFVMQKPSIIAKHYRTLKGLPEY